MQHLHKVLAGAVLAAAFGIAFASSGSAQEQPPPTQDGSPRYTSQDGPTGTATPPSTELPPEAKAATGRRERGMPIQAYAVAPGTKFLVSIEGDLTTKEA